MRSDNVLTLLRDAVLGDPVTKQEERIEAAMLAVAKCQGDMRQAESMVECYRKLAAAVDAHDDWWLFAQRKQKHHEYTQQLTALSINLEQLYARLRKLMEDA